VVMGSANKYNIGNFMILINYHIFRFKFQLTLVTGSECTLATHAHSVHNRSNYNSGFDDVYRVGLRRRNNLKIISYLYLVLSVWIYLWHNKWFYKLLKKKCLKIVIAVWTYRMFATFSWFVLFQIQDADDTDYA